jgi:hypothetical protein
MLAANARTKWNGESETSAASVSTVCSPARSASIH